MHIPNYDLSLVILGGDHPLALPLIADLEKKGYIEIASVSTLEAIETIEHKCNGYVRALVLDPGEVCVIATVFSFTNFILSRSAWNDTDLLTLSRIHTFSKVPYQCSRRSPRVPIFTALHSFYHLASYSSASLSLYSPNATRTPPYPVHLLTISSGYPCNSYPPNTGSFAPTSHITSQGP